MGSGLLSAAADLIRLIRYRFLLFAGLLPFGLGQVVAWRESGSFDSSVFAVALTGLAFVLIGVESFNEYFDARIGTDRVFSLEREEVPRSTFICGLVSFSIAAAVMLILTVYLGWQVVMFAAVGAVAACFYVTPPVKLAYRGLGEMAIVLSYGPMMTAGSFFVQTRRMAIAPFIASIIPALLILCVTVINEIPDFFGDRICGKRNLTVRLGRVRAIWLCGIASFVCFVFILGAALSGIIPKGALIALIPFPLTIRNFFIARQNIDNPKAFIPAIRGAILVYSIAVILLGIGYLI